VKFKSPVYSQASGSIAGITYSHNLGGLYTRARTIPVNSQTSQQQAVRNFVSTLAARWTQTLTAAQRAGWETYALNVPITDTLGDPRTVTGLNHYIRANVPRLQIALTIIDAAPVIFSGAVLQLISMTPDASADTISVTYINTDEWANAVGGALILYGSRPVNPSVNYFKGPYRLYTFVLGAATPPSSPIISAAPFPIDTGQKVFVQGRATTADGRLSAPFRLGAIVVA